MEKQPSLCAAGSQYLYPLRYTNNRLAAPWLRRLVAGHLPWRPGFGTRLFYVRFVMDKVAVGQVFIRIFLFSPVYTIPTLIRTHRHLRCYYKKEKRVKARNLPQINALSEIGKH
jgi:hypothetical protein